MIARPLVHDLLDATARRRPGATAVTDAAGSHTFAQLLGVVDDWTRWLHGVGVGPGDRVVALVENDVTTAGLLYAASRLGAVLAPLHPATRAPLVRHVVGELEPLVVLAARDPGVVHVSYRSVAAYGLTPPPAPRPRSDDEPLLVIYTSGSTAMPKGIVCPQRSIVFAAQAIAGRLAYRESDVVFCCLPLSFDYGLYQVLLTTIAGCELVLARPDLAGPTVLRDLRAAGATVVPLVPSLAENLVKLAVRRPLGTQPVRLITNTGAELTDRHRQALRAAFPGASLTTMFGLTECKRVTISDPDDDVEHPGTVGRALPGTTIRVVDHRGHPCPAGRVGELVVLGPHVMAGYWGDPELTGATFRPSPATGEVELHTGDLCSLDDAGHLRYVGRRDGTYKQGGFRVSTAELEAAARSLPGIDDAAALPPDDTGGALLVAVGDRTRQELADGLREVLEPHKLPPRLDVVDALPRTPNGKLDRRALAELVR